MRLALVQPELVKGDPVTNLDHITQLVEEAIQGRPDIVILPEMWNTSYALDKLMDLADREGKPSASKMADLAHQYEVSIVAGSVADLRDSKLYNTAYVYNREGQEAASYSKMHLFSLMDEHMYLQPGNARTLFQLEGISCGLIICYDLRFPELSRALALDGAQILFIPAQWPYPRMHPWRTLLQARAIENQFFVVGVNRVGREGKTEFFGHSMVVDPLGNVVAEGTEGEEIIQVEIDLTEVAKTRQHMTCFPDRVPEAYR